MENFDSDPEAHPSAYVKVDDPFFACEIQQEELVKRSCYAWSSLEYLNTHPYDYTGALTWCANAAWYGVSCAHGVGMITAIHNLDVAFIEDTCRSAPTSELVKACVSGATQALAKEYSDFELAREACGLFSEERNKEECERAVSAMPEAFESR